MKTLERLPFCFALLTTIVVVMLPARSFAQTVKIARWSMDDTGTCCAQVLDLDTAVGQGVLAGAAPVSASEDDLWYISCTQPYTTDSTTPPLSMLTAGNNGGAVSYNAG